MLLNLITSVAANVSRGISALKLPVVARSVGGAVLNPQDACALVMDKIASKNVAVAAAMGGVFTLSQLGFAAGMYEATLDRRAAFPPKPLPFQSKRSMGKGGKGPIMTPNGPQYNA